MYRLALLSAALAIVYAYPQGPPVAIDSTLCGNMYPTLHGGEAQKVAPPFEILLSSQCYKENSKIQVRIQITNTSWYFEGFFVQMRKGDDDTMSYGTFSTDGQADIDALPCFGKSDNAVGQNTKRHYWTRTFSWTAPSSNEGNLHIRATLVKNQVTYWVGVKSEEIKYDAACVAPSTLGTAKYQDIQEGWVDGSEDKTTTGPTAASMSPSYVISYYVTILTAMIALMFVRK